MSRSRGVPIWARPEPGARRPRLTRARIASVAVGIADREGMDAVSMRRVAAELGVGTMTLYYYVRTKDDLIALMDDAIMGELLVPADALPADWRGALTAIARRTRAAFLRHPWALSALRGALPGPNALRHLEQSLAALANTSLDEVSKFELLSLVDDYVFGHTLRLSEVEGSSMPEGEAATALIDWVAAELRSGQYPHLQMIHSEEEARDSWEQLMDRMTDEERFERGLQALLDGAAMRLGLPLSGGDREAAMDVGPRGEPDD